jgi:hypothetical protein
MQDETRFEERGEASQNRQEGAEGVPVADRVGRDKAGMGTECPGMAQ